MIRPAIPADIYRLVEMGKAFFAETGWDKQADFDVESYAYSCAMLMDGGGILLVAEKDGDVVAMVAAGTCPATWNRNVLLGQELWWYCEPASRKGNVIGSKLMTALEDAFVARGVCLASMSAEEGMRSDALGRLYRQRGYFPRERLFWKQMSPGKAAA